jgi:putative YphP/YqiW family bacilliredoxin
MVIPMREELTRLGIQELRTEAEVDQAIPNQPGTTMVVVNSICGCAAGRMRPAVRAALQHSSRPERLFTVFAGQDKDAPNAPVRILRDIRPLLLRLRCCATAR